MIPFITDYIFRRLYSKTSIHKETFPRTLKLEEDYGHITEALVEFNSKVWNTKKSRGLSLKDQINIKIPKELQPFSKDLKAMHNIKS